MNWGPYDFQLRTFFGLESIDDPLFSGGVPRDFFMCYMEKSFEVYAETNSLEKAMNAIDEHYEMSEVANKSVMKPPKEGSGKRSRVLPEYRAYIYSNISMNSESWIEPYLGRIGALCREQGPVSYTHLTLPTKA